MVPDVPLSLEVLFKVFPIKMLQHHAHYFLTRDLNSEKSVTQPGPKGGLKMTPNNSIFSCTRLFSLGACTYTISTWRIYCNEIITMPRFCSQILVIAAFCPLTTFYMVRAPIIFYLIFCNKM